MRKRILSGLLSAAVMLSLAGCGMPKLFGKTQVTQPDPAPQEAADVLARELVVGVVAAVAVRRDRRGLCIRGVPKPKHIVYIQTVEFRF